MAVVAHCKHGAAAVGYQLQPLLSTFAGVLLLLLLLMISVFAAVPVLEEHDIDLSRMARAMASWVGEQWTGVWRTMIGLVHPAAGQMAAERVASVQDAVSYYDMASWAGQQATP